jgi:glycosyltransferase involved in cell wall biosynthesis
MSPRTRFAGQLNVAITQSRDVDVSVVIATYNRASLLRATMESLLRSATDRRWDIVIVDNNSVDDTRQVVATFAASSPVPVLYLQERRQGKSSALNTGITRAQGDVLLLTDDDVEVDPGWLESACTAFERHPDVDYVGGPVDPIWEVPPPPWFDQKRSDLWGTVAILDYGTDPFIFESRRRVPLGANMAIRKRLVDRIGAFHPELGRTGQSLLGQEQAEFLARARAHHLQGMYLPAMRVAHHVPASRLTKDYFRRWWFWKGRSRARVDAMHHETELGLDLRRVPYVLGVPRYVWGQIPREAFQWLRARLTARRTDAMRHAMRLAYCFGYIRACWSRRPAAPLDRLALPNVPA